jgi:ribosome biogenesis GTPase A
MPADRIDADLARLAEVAIELGVEPLVTEIAEERHRLLEARFFVACIGQFKRGKSTLLNALVDFPILPVGVVPVTSVPTILREGRAPGALVRFTSGRTQLISIDQVADLVDERRNPENAMGVAVVEVLLPSAILEHGLCLVDTPGIGSIFEANTAVTRTFLPHIDVALLVVGPDPPITGDELDMAARVGREVEHFLLVLNKADQASDEQRRESLTFTTQALERRLSRGIDAAFEVSALERGRDEQPTRDWSRLENALRGFAETRRSVLVAMGVDRARRRIARRLHAEVEEQDGALRRPLHETAARAARLRHAVADVDRSLRDLRFLFDAVEIELTRVFEQQRTAFVRSHTPDLQRALRMWIGDHRDMSRQQRRNAAFEYARRLAEESVTSWLAQVEPDVVAQYDRATSRFVELGNNYITRVTADADIDVDGMERTDVGTYERPQFYFTSLMHLTAGTPWTWLVDRLGSRALRERSIVARTSEYLTHLVDSNSHRVENDFRERTAISRRELERKIRGRLSEALESAERALAVARRREAMAQDQARAQLARFAVLRNEVHQLQGD